MAKTTKKVERELPAAADALRKGMRAYVGVYGMAYDRLVDGFKSASKNFDILAEKGEKVEAELQTTIDARVAKFRAALPDVANDRIDAIEAEINRLTGKAEKSAKKATKTAKKTTKTAKKSAVKSATKAKKTVAKTAKKTTKTVAKTAKKTAETVKKAA